MINIRQLHRPQQTPQELDIYALQGFHDDVHREFKDVQQNFDRHNATISFMQDRLNRLETMLTWIKDHRPEAIIDFQTTMDVTNRLSDSNDGEVMTEKMV